MRILTFTTLYPNAAAPSHGVFVENRLVHLVASGRIDSVVVAPVPWFPFTNPVFGRYAAFARVPRSETRHGLRIHHPRFPTVPVLGALIAPFLMALAGRQLVSRLIADGERFDAIDAHYFFPDGVAAALLGRWLDLPVVITARGSDINVIANEAIPGRLIRWAAQCAAHVVTVSSALRDATVALGVDPRRVTVLRNGVDATRFSPVDRTAARQRFGLAADARVVVSVGRLTREKGHDFAIEAVAALPGVHLLVAGTGEEKRRLEARIDALGVADRVRLLGSVPHDQLRELYSSADALVLASAREGWPNVLLEAMACGTPVVATDVGGIREIVTTRDAGIVLGACTAPAITAALSALFADPPDRGATRRYSERFSWDETTRGQERIFESLGQRSEAPVREALR